jgi:hypothetical protein
MYAFSLAMTMRKVLVSLLCGRSFRACGLLVLLTVLTVGSGAWALDRSPNGYFHTGDGVRVKKVVFASVDVYAIGHEMKELPPQKSKEAVIDLDVSKRFVWVMKRDVEAEKIRNALTEAYSMNGYGDHAKIAQFMGAFKGDLKEKQWVTITYDADKKTTTLSVQGGGSATVAGVDFMKATWRLWFGKIDQPALGDALISRI